MPVVDVVKLFLFSLYFFLKYEKLEMENDVVALNNEALTVLLDMQKR